MLKLNTTLEAVNMGDDQESIAAYVSAMPQWLAYVKAANAAGIPGNDAPTDEWLSSQGFHPDNLITEACRALGWATRPGTGGLQLNFYETKN